MHVCVFVYTIYTILSSQVCRNGKCTAEIENIIPDYTHVTQTISRSPISRSDNSIPSTPSRRSHSRFRNRSGLLRPTTESSLPTIDGGNAASIDGPNNNSNNNNRSNNNGECKDTADKLGGSLTCAEFLEMYSSRYCGHDYVKRNCCATHALMCPT